MPIGAVTAQTGQASSGSMILPALSALRDFFGLGGSRRRRFLVCDEMLPDPSLGAGYPRANAMIRVLAQAGCQITVAPVLAGSLGGDSPSASEYLPPEVEVAPLDYLGKQGIERLLRKRPRHYTDLIISRPTTMAELRPLLDRSPELFQRMNITYDAEAIFACRENPEAELAGRPVSQEEKQRRIEDELDLCRGVQRVFAVSEHEASIFRARGYKTFLVGHATKPADPAVCRADLAARSDFLFVGAIHGDSGPNYDFVMWFLEKVWPGLARRFPTTRFVVAGLNRSKRLTEEPLPERVVVTRRLSDLSPVYSAARVFVAPTRASSGIPLKVIEAAGYGVPVVATSLLAGQLSWRVPSEICTADTPEEFMDACSLLFRDRARWEVQRQAALQRIHRDYSEATFSRQVRSALNLLAADSH